MRNLILTGMPACGKSTLGVVLAKTLGMKFVDTDLLIQEVENCRLQEIIDERGMQEFLRIEEKVLSEIEAENSIISTGGSAVYSDKAMKHLGSIGDVVYIKLSLDEIERRLNNIKTRGIAMKPGETLADLYNMRVPLYEKYADVVVNESNINVEETVQLTLEKIKEYKGEK